MGYQINSPPRASIIIPAYNEERSIGRLLGALTKSEDAERWEIVVAANGCDDATVAAATSFGVTVLDLPAIGKHAAMRAADETVSAFPRVYLDADVEVSAQSLSALIDAVAQGKALASGPARVIPRDGVPWNVRWYYDVWENLPGVATSLYGRGVVALSKEGFERVAALPSVMADDLAVSEAFDETERLIVRSASVVVHPPRTWADLIRRRTRIITGNRQADEGGLRHPKSPTGLRALVEMTRRRPTLLPKVALFVFATAQARLRAGRAIGRRDFTTWERDESSRT
ncbi:glycosyltransferase [Salana multivorans]